MPLRHFALFVLMACTVYALGFVALAWWFDPTGREVMSEKLSCPFSNAPYHPEQVFTEADFGKRVVCHAEGYEGRVGKIYGFANYAGKPQDVVIHWPDWGDDESHQYQCESAWVEIIKGD